MHLNSPSVRRLMLFGVPLAVAALGLIHPGSATNPGADGDTIYQQLRDQADLFIAVHLLQLVVLSLLAGTVWFMIRGLRGAWATASRAALLVFAVVYAAFDSVAGIAVGSMVKEGHTLPAADQASVDALVEAYQDSLVTGYFSVLGGIGSLAWLVALVSAAMVLRAAGARTLVVVSTILAGVVFGIGHPAPFGPIGMVFLLLAAWGLETARGERRRGAEVARTERVAGGVGG